MPDDIKKTVQRSQSDDSRRIETCVEESTSGVATERVTTVKEEIVPMTVKKVIRETIVPVVTSRKIESYEDGKVIKTDHEVVPDEALQLAEYEQKLNHQDIAKIVEEAIKRNMPKQVVLQEKEKPKIKSLKAPAKTSEEIIEEHIQPKAKKGLELDVNMEVIIYSIMAIECGILIYLTVLKGWLLNI